MSARAAGRSGWVPPEILSLAGPIRKPITGKWLDFPIPTKTDHSGQFTTYVELGQPGPYRLRVLDPNSGVTSKAFVLVIKD